MKKIAASMLAIMSILTVCFPAIALWYVDHYQINEIEYVIEHDGISILRSGKYINSVAGNQTVIQQDFDDLLWTFGYPQAAMPTLTTFKEDTLKARPENVKASVVDNITVINNRSYVFLDSQFAAPAHSSSYVFHWLNITTHNISKLDGIILNQTQLINMTGEWGLTFVMNTLFLADRIEYPANFVGTQIIKVDNNTHFIPFSNTLKIILLSNPDGRVWLYYTDINTLLISNYLNYTWQIEIGETTDIFIIQPLMLTMIILIFIIVISGIFTIFATDIIDIKFDK